MLLSDFVSLINHQYLKPYHTVLLGGFSEPLYLPSVPPQFAQIQFTQDYFRSALHELAHWCVAGSVRRQLIDYGYWYTPDGRTLEQQQQFFACEMVPQAFEWALSLACEQPFEVSVDNLNQPPESGTADFKRAVRERLEFYLNTGFPPRLEALLKLIHAQTATGNLYVDLSQRLGLSKVGTDNQR
jgi:elongation factor P hydroxylase